MIKLLKIKLKYLIENHLINIDVDIMEQKKLNSDSIISKLMEIWKMDPINNFKSLLRNLDNEYIEFNTTTQNLINNTFTKLVKTDTINTKIEFNEDSQKLPTGKECICVELDSNGEEEIEDVMEKQEEIQISFTKDVLPCIIPLVCILTIKNSNMDFVKMLNDIKENPELLDIFDEQCLIWWNKKELIDLIKEIVNKYFDKTSNTYNISIQFKMSLQSLIDKPKELLELINDCLKPKKIEKKEYGEVFTPMNIINEMLDKLPVNVWTNKKLKWFDPATGMGNFPIAIYLRLMEGLKNVITDNTKRKKHILEKMLYMSELNKKNYYIIKQIFNINNKYKLNLYEGDSLKIDIKKEFGLDKFDVIIGNPPYNEELKSTGAKPLYNKFIEYYIDKCQLLSFITPSHVGFLEVKD